MRLRALLTPITVLVVLALLTTPVSATPPSQANDPIDLTFQKCAVSYFIWLGIVGGDLNGFLIAILTDLRETGSVTHMSWSWFVFADGVAFVADLSGILSMKTGRVVMNGVITSGWLQGAQIHVAAQLDFVTICSAGDMRIMPLS